MVNKLTTIIQHKDIKNAGSIPGTINSFGNEEVIPLLSHINTVAIPEIIPVIAPHFVVRLHQRDSIIKGPKDAARPPQANATKK